MTFGRFRGAAALIFTLGLIAITSAVAAGIVEFAALRLKPRASAALEAELKLDAESAAQVDFAGAQ